MAIKLGDIARTLGIGALKAVGQAGGFWSKQVRDTILARSYYAPYPLTHIHDGGLGEFIDGQKTRGIEYDRVPISVDSPVGGSNVNYKRLISQEVARTINHAHETVAGVFIVEKYAGRRGNKTYEAVALIPRAPTGPAYRAAYPGPSIRSPLPPS